jgi:hypothetical protein
MAGLFHAALLFGPSVEWGERAADALLRGFLGVGGVEPEGSADRPALAFGAAEGRVGPGPVLVVSGTPGLYNKLQALLARHLPTVLHALNRCVCMRVCGGRVHGAAHAPCSRGLSHATSRVGSVPAPCWYKLRVLDVCSPSSLCGSCPSFHAGVGLDSFRGRQPMQGPGPEREAAASMFAEEPWRSLVTTVVHALRLPEPPPVPGTGPSLRPARGVSQQTVRRLRDCLQVGKM